MLFKKKISSLFFILIISPVTFLFYINDNALIGRKEVLLFLVFSIFLYQLSRGKFSEKKEALILVSISVATLFHEMVLFFIPYFLIALYITDKKIEVKRYVLYVLSAFIPVVLIILFGGKINEGNTYKILLERGVDMRNHSGILDWPDNFNAINYVKLHSYSYLLYGLSLILGIMQFGLYVYSENRQYLRILAFGFLAALVCTTPMFLFTIDYGRWLNIHFVMLLLLCIYILPEKSPQLNYSTPFFNKKMFLLGVIIIFNLFWKLEHINAGFEIHKYKFGAVNKIFRRLPAVFFLFSFQAAYAQVPLESVELKTLKGALVSFSNLSQRDSLVLVCFWSPSSDASINELNAINAHYNHWKNSISFRFIPVCIAEGGTNRIRPISNMNGWVFEVYADITGNLRKALNANSLPQSLILKKGKVIYQLSGYESGTENYLLQKMSSLASGRQ